jgi:hypothetical protein
MLKALSFPAQKEFSISQLLGFKNEKIKVPLLRRVDWRFLLKDPHPQRSVCYVSGLLSEAVALISGETVSPDKAIPGSCDLAVVSNPDKETLHAAWSSLRPGGMLYGEWYSPWAGGSPRIRKQLEATGFREIDCYWPWPWPERSSTLFWLPLEALSTLDYFLNSRPPSKSLKEGIFRTILRPAWKLAHRARLLVPLCVTASKQDSELSRSRREGSDLFEALKDGWAEWNLGPSPGSIYWLMLTGGLRRINKVVKMGFSPSEPEPCLVVKHARVPETNPSLAREARNLRSLEGQPGGGPKNVPRLLLLHRLGDSLALVETVVAGHPMYTFLKKENYRSFALKATEWLLQLVRPDMAIPRPEWWVRNSEPVLKAFERKYGQELGGNLSRQIRENLLQVEALPVAFEHRDFSAWNVLITDDGSLSVLDWDDAEPDGLPGMDLIFFLTTLALLHDGAMSTGQFRTVYRTAQDPNSFTGSVQAECLRIYFEALGLSPDSARPLRLLGWAFHSLAALPRIGSQEDPFGANHANPFIQFLLEDLSAD